MARLTVGQADYLRSQCHALRQEGLGIRAIGRQLGIEPKSVRRYLSQAIPAVYTAGMDPVSHSELLSELVALKTRYPHRGSSQLRAMLAQQFPTSVIPCESSLDNYLRALGLTRKAKRFGQGGRPYWTQSRPVAPRDLYQADTVKFTLHGGVRLEFLTVKDVVSGFAWAGLITDWQSDTLVSLFARAFAVMGVPRSLQIDNGLGFVLPRRLSLGRLHSYVFGRGVGRILYIPEGEPQRNGSIESWHRWLKNEWWHSDTSMPESDVPAWVADRVSYYNEVKPHLGLGGKGCRKTPASVHPAGDGVIITDSVGVGVVSWIRLVLSAGFAVVKNPAFVAVLGPSLGGRYVRIDWDYRDESGSVWTHPASTASTSDSVQSNGRIVGAVPDPVLVGRFGDLGSVVRVDHVKHGLTPISLDDEAVLATWRKVLKQAAPSFVPAGFELRHGPSGWSLVDKAGNELLSDESGFAYLEHGDELLG